MPGSEDGGQDSPLSRLEVSTLACVQAIGSRLGLSPGSSGSVLLILTVVSDSAAIQQEQCSPEERRRLKNAIIIQSFIRGYRDRKQQYSLQRSAFDRCAHLAQSGGTFSVTSAPNLTLLVRQLLFFYKQSEDAKRLIWLYQNLIKHSSLFVKQLDGSERPTCLFQIKRLMSLCCRLLQSCNDDSLNVALPMRMLEVFSSENTYLPVLQDASYVVSVIEQILHYMIHSGRKPSTLGLLGLEA
ncbi:ubiquitin-protein ligase E3C-like [Marmota flaviventris]|uniref:ubiquitin-protein ligase E3C-like n=1 Tax=Marmota flaviventris TaxID=93162 RepID=UPI003A867CF3